MAVVFDLGNVLIQWDPRHLFRKMFGGDDERMEWFLRHVCTTAWNELHDAGQPFAVGVRNLVAVYPDYRPYIEAYFARWPEMLHGEVPGTVAILRALHTAGVPLYALSNWSTETFPVAQAQFPFLQWFRGIVLSGEERVIKPDPRIYQILLERYDLVPQQTIFIDDAAKNVEAARARGMTAIHFTGALELQKSLEHLGL